MNAQDSTYGQFWNEFSFSRHLGHKWVIEFDMGQKWTGTPHDPKMFTINSQIHATVGGHFYLNTRWKFSYYYSYYYNKYVPEIKQKQLPELRSAFQVIYFLHKTRYTVNARARIEDRHLKTDDGKFEAFYRFRGQIKMVYPINNKIIQKNTIYAIGSEEIYFKNNSQVAGSGNVDRNCITIGAGYAITDNMQVEVTYVNEFLPRNDGNEIYNILQVNLGFNNLFSNVAKRFLRRNQNRETIGSH